MDKEYLEAIRMIDKIYKELYTKDEVVHRVKNKYDKYENIKSYIDRLERIHEKAKYNNNFVNMLKRYYYDKYVIKSENIPDSYYNHQQQLAFERGYGKVEITDEMKKEYQRQIINDQKKSLDIWLDYFFSDDSNYIPMWAKFWSFQGMLKLGPYNKETGKFNKREDNTTGVFADLNREALAISIDYVRKMLNKEKIDDESLEKLVKSGSFKKIYEYVLNNLLKNSADNFKSNDGIWIKYNQGSDHMPLVRSLQGYNTGWCTAGEATAKSQLKGGDFYVYYTKDENEEYKIPRIAIRMEGNSIGEIRGVASNQNIEPSMEKVVEEKIKDFPDKDKYYKKVHDMEYLTYIYELNKNGGNLSKDDLEFLYEISGEIQGFGYRRDPRISEIQNGRDKRKDLSVVFNCSIDEVALNQEESVNDDENQKELFANPDKIVYLYGYIRTDFSKVNFPKLRYITGNGIFYLLKCGEGLENLQVIGGDADFKSLTSALGLGNLKSIGFDAYFDSLTSAKGLENLQSIGGEANFDSLTSAKGLENLQSIGGYANFGSLISAEGLENLQSIGGYANFYSLRSAKGLGNLQSIGKEADFQSLTSAKGLGNLQSIGGEANFGSLISAEGLGNLQSIGGTAWFKSLTNLNGFNNLVIGGNAHFESLTSLDGLENITIGGKLYLNPELQAEYEQTHKKS